MGPRGVPEHLRHVDNIWCRRSVHDGGPYISAGRELYKMICPCPRSAVQRIFTFPCPHHVSKLLAVQLFGYSKMNWDRGERSTTVCKSAATLSRAKQHQNAVREDACR